jgi:hypothetical protein
MNIKTEILINIIGKLYAIFRLNLNKVILFYTI